MMDPIVSRRLAAIEETIDEIVSRLEKLEAARNEEVREEEV